MARTFRCRPSTPPPPAPASALTAIGNDYGFDYVFARQLEALGKKGDIAIGITTSGNSANVIRAFEECRKQGITTVGFTGATGGLTQAEYKAIADRRVRLGLLLAEIGRLKEITVTPDEMVRAMRTEAGRYPGQEQQIMDLFRKNPNVAETLRGPIFEEKVVDYLLELVKVADKPTSREDLMREDEDDKLV